MTASASPLEPPARPAVTRESARALATEQAADASTVREVVHEEFNGDPVAGGFAFLRDEVMLIVGIAGGRSWFVDPGTDEARREAVEAFRRTVRRQQERAAARAAAR